LLFVGCWLFAVGPHLQLPVLILVADHYCAREEEEEEEAKD